MAFNHRQLRDDQVWRFCISLSAQHFTVFRFFPILPLFCAFFKWAQALGTWHEVLPISTVTVPIFFATRIASSVSGCTYVPTAITKPFMAYRQKFGRL